VYTPDRAELAAKNFFREGNLTALREMALRLAAERVDQQMQDYMHVEHIQGPWRSTERLMVAVSASPLSERLIRWTRRTAYNLKAPWIAVYIEPVNPLSEAAKAQLARNLSLVHKLGGDVVTASDKNVVSALMQVARQRNITQIVVGKPARSRIQEMVVGGSLVNRLIRASDNVDIYVIQGDAAEAGEHRLIVRPTLHSGPNQYVVAVAIVSAVVLINLVLLPLIGYQEVALILLFMIVIMANFLGRGPILAAAIVSALLWDYSFIPPRFTFYISTFQDALTLGLYIGHVFDAEIVILLPIAPTRLSKMPHPVSTYSPDEKELSVATWAFDNAKPAGKYTDTLPIAAAQYLPLITPSGVSGVMGIRMRKPEELSTEQEALLQTFVGHIAFAVERELLEETEQNQAVFEESERLYATLLDSVPHALRTPLAVITGSTSLLFNPATKDNPETMAVLSQNTRQAVERLNRLVDNLLDMTRLQSGRLMEKRIRLVEEAGEVEAERQ